MKQIYIYIALTIFTACKDNKIKNIETNTKNGKSEKLNVEKTVITTDSFDQQVKNVEELVTKAAVDATKTEIAELNQRKEQLKNQGFNNFILFDLNDQLSADFNGDNITDNAEVIREDGYAAIISITDGKTHKHIKIGNGNQYGKMQENFAWANYWGIVQPQETFEEIIKGYDIIDEKKTKLLYTSILIRNEEGNGGIITYRNGKYDWVHQAD